MHNTEETPCHKVFCPEDTTVGSLLHLLRRWKAIGDLIGDHYLTIFAEEIKVFLYESVSYHFALRYAATRNLSCDSEEEIAEDMKKAANWRYDN